MTKPTKQIVGEPLDRVDGRLKVTGGAKFAAEFSAPNLAHAVLVQSTIANGKVTKIDTGEALKAPGVIAVITHENKPALMDPKATSGGEHIPALSPDISYSGQSIAVVVAETFEQAEEGARLVQVEYASEPAEIVMENRLDSAEKGTRGGTSRGDVAAALASAAVKVEQTYRSTAEHHNPMEPHASFAVWEGNKLTQYDSTQGVTNSAHNLATQFGLKPEDVRVIDPFVGGGFGCKGQSWPHSGITAMAAYVVKRPVRLSLSRKQMFSSNGHRPETRQEIALGAGADGKLTAIQFHGTSHTSIHESFTESTGASSIMLYSCPNAHVDHQVVRLNVGPPTFMRAPGYSVGSFGLETAMDELAAALNMDPLELRLRNYSETDESLGVPYSSKSLRECYAKGAEAFGWSRRSPRPGVTRQGRELIGYGMATALYPSHFAPASAKATMNANGTVLVQCGTQDLGTGTYTILTQIAAENLGVDPKMVRVEIADTALPPAPNSGGSVSATSAGSAVQLASVALRESILALAAAQTDSPLTGHTTQEVSFGDGRLVSSRDSKSQTYVEILRRAGKASVSGEATARPGAEHGGQNSKPQFSFYGHGVQFCEVRVDTETKSIRVARAVGAFALGKILNRKTLTSQLYGGMIWGIGMGLLEESVPDVHYARYVNSNLAEYHVPTNKDVPPMEVILVEEDDPHVSPLGAKGAGEIGITGMAAAIGNAVYHATGKRVRDLPITLDKLF